MPEPEHLVRIHFPFEDAEDFERWNEIEGRLDLLLQGSGLGEHDGNEVGEGEYTIWLYGPDAASLAQFVRNALSSEKLPKECYMFLRFGDVEDESAREETVALS